MRLFVSLVRRPVASQWIYLSGRGFKSQSNKEKRSTSIQTHRLIDSGPARTRFAPSPTGFLHLGSLRTALFNYLIAKVTGGQFLLRIEDTDQKRTIDGAEERLYQDLEWAGIEWDEGPKKGGPYGPYKQSERTALYREAAEALLNYGHAYRCFCSPQRLHTLAEYRSRLGQPPDYDRTCAHIHKDESDDRASKGEAHVIRLKVPETYPDYRDLIYGLVNQKKPSNQASVIGSFDDPILIKTDGFPTYHLANVVDDHMMEITHVIRGSEWMSSTPKHLALYEAFGWQPPEFAHVSLLVDKDRRKLSKRTGSIEIADFREKGVFPETLCNFVALLGWSHNNKYDLMSMRELIASVGRAENENFSYYQSIQSPEKKSRNVEQLLKADAQNYTTPTEFIDRNIYFFSAPTKEILKENKPALKLHKVPPSVKTTVDVAVFREALKGFEDMGLKVWNEPAFIKTLTTSTYVKFAQRGITDDEDPDWMIRAKSEKSWCALIHSFLRWALVAGMPGPDSSFTMCLLGREETLKRLELAIEILQEDDSVNNNQEDGLPLVMGMGDVTPQEAPIPEETLQARQAALSEKEYQGSLVFTEKEEESGQNNDSGTDTGGSDDLF
ncbi:hypothetical protein G7Y89_g4291 [Cudoniella acicularis]|uniref:Glutamate--tRNA ligase, mitochondrial n=1 Tax=Cudoniella acicularis TaxID=354080 RepID=A0A8H4W4F6_9HELO|nr:hypothetical protein G7Y89_g4291 [Cudoniella acicularis]